jgi:hypothetical protein
VWSRRGPRNALSVQMRSRAATGRGCHEGVFGRVRQGRPKQRSGLCATNQVQSHHFSFEAWTNNSWMIAPKVHVVGPHEVVEAGPSRVSDRLMKSTKGKEKVVEFLEMGEVEGAKSVGLSDEHWGVHQWFLADRIFKKQLEIEVLFKEIMAIEAMMQE